MLWMIEEVRLAKSFGYSPEKGGLSNSPCRYRKGSRVVEEVLLSGKQSWVSFDSVIGGPQNVVKHPSLRSALSRYTQEDKDFLKARLETMKKSFQTCIDKSDPDVKLKGKLIQDLSTMLGES